jgi:hypothetical protein
MLSPAMLARKSSRKIVVGDVEYRYKVSRWRRVSGWTPAKAGLVDERWLAHAHALGLGAMADVEFTIAIEHENEPVSKLIVTYHAHIIDGFLGPEQFTRIQPKLVATLIETALASGWKPEERGDVRLHIVENSGAPERPALLVLPGLNEDMADYDNRIRVVRVR